MIKTIMLIGILALEVNSCNDRGLPERMAAEYRETKEACISRGGIPINEPVHDAGTGYYLNRISRCDFPPVLSPVDIVPRLER